MMANMKLCHGRFNIGRKWGIAEIDHIAEMAQTAQIAEQAPGSGFHPRDESTKISCGFFGACWCNTKIDPER